METDSRQSKIDALILRVEEIANVKWEIKKAYWIEKIRPRFIEKLEKPKPLSLAELDEKRWPNESILDVLDSIIDGINREAANRLNQPPIVLANDYLGNLQKFDLY